MEAFIKDILLQQAHAKWRGALMDGGREKVIWKGVLRRPASAKMVIINQARGVGRRHSLHLDIHYYLQEVIRQGVRLMGGPYTVYLIERDLILVEFLYIYSLLKTL